MNPSSAVASYQEFGHSNMKINKCIRDSREGGMPTVNKESSVEKKGRECNTEVRGNQATCMGLKQSLLEQEQMANKTKTRLSLGVLEDFSLSHNNHIRMQEDRTTHSFQNIISQGKC